MGDIAGKVKSKSEKQREKKAKDKPKTREYLVVKFEALKADTEKGKKLLAAETQSALIYRAVAKAKTPPTFAEIIAAVSPALKGKSETTILANSRWYVNDLKKKGFLKHVEEKVKAASQDEARGAE